MAEPEGRDPRSFGQALPDERIQLDVAKQVKLKLKTKWRNGASVLTSSLESMQQLVSRPRAAPDLVTG